MNADLLIAASDPYIHQWAQEISVQALPGVMAFPYQDLNQLASALSDARMGSAVLIDLIWHDVDQSAYIESLIAQYPRMAWVIVSRYDLGAYRTRFNLPIYSQVSPDTMSQLMRMVSEDLSGQVVGSYQIKEFFTMSQLGRTYLAHQIDVHRDVFLTLSPPSPTEDQNLLFTQSVAAMGTIIHPVTYAVFESGQVAGRWFMSEEPVVSKNIFELQKEGVRLDPRLITKILHTICVLIGHLHQGGFSYRAITPRDVTLSRDGIVKIRNVGYSQNEANPDTYLILQNIAGFLFNLLNPSAPKSEKIVNLLHRLANCQVELLAATNEANNIEVELAPVKNVPQRQETILLEQEIKKSKSKFWIMFGIGTFLGLCLAIFLLIHYIENFLPPPPGIIGSELVKIPAGTTKVQKPKGAGFDSVAVPEFEIERYEVTLGQYKAFIDEYEPQIQSGSKKVADMLPPWFLQIDPFIAKLAQDTKTLRPDDWGTIEIALDKRKRFLGDKLDFDYPVFNVNLIKAMAYAHSKGMRLPTENEWTRAASGDLNLDYPFGQQLIKYESVRDWSKTSFALFNSGVDVNEDLSKGVSFGSVDGFRSLTRVDMPTLKDISAFGIIGMAGNVSEWTLTNPELGKRLMPGQVPIKGGHFQQAFIAPNYFRIGGRADASNSALGFRCVKGPDPDYVGAAANQGTPETSAPEKEEVAPENAEQKPE